jgi:hypothetical protein
MSAPWLHIEEEETPEGTTIVVRGTIVDDSEPPVELGAGDLTFLRAWMFERSDAEEPIEDWTAKNVLNANGGTFTGTAFALRIPPADNMMVRLGRRETRVLQLRWGYNGGEDEGYAEVNYPIRNRPYVGPTS